MKIAVLMNGIEHEAHRRLLKGMERYAKEHDVSIFVFTCMNIHQESEYGMGEIQIFNLPDYAQYDGVIFVGNPIRYSRFGRDIMQQITQAHIPVVSIESRMEGMPVFYTDNRAAMRELVTHLIETHQVEKICYLSGPRDSSESVDRLRGVIDAVKAHGLTLEEDQIYYGNYLADSGSRLAEKLLESDKGLPEAIVCGNDFMAFGVYIELSRRGIRIGEDVLLTGYDNMSDTVNLTPAITTLEKPQVQIGYEACRSLMAKKKIRNRKFQVKCCFRESCGCSTYKMENLIEIQLRDMQEKLEISGMGETNKYMVSDLNECDNMEEFCKYLRRYIIQLDFSYVYLCLCEEKEAADGMEYDCRSTECFSESVCIPVAYERGEFTQYPAFNSKELLPAACREKLGTEIYIVEPIHFRRKWLGYLVVCGNELPFHTTQFQNLMTSISSSLENIRKQNELKRLVEKLNQVWMMDSLTQVYNRAGFFHYANRILEDCKTRNTEIGVLFIDINKLKQVNDTYGHKEGDFYIKAVADCLTALKEPEQLLMRYGGDEFVVLGKYENKTEFGDLIQGLNPMLEKRRLQHDKTYEMSVSEGFYSVAIRQGFKLDRLIEQADQEMYKAKMHARGCQEKILDTTSTL